MPASPIDPPQGELRNRLQANWRLKVSGVTAFMGIFFAAYFLLLRFPVFAVTTMPVTALDRMIPFQPATLVLYFSLWVYVSIPPSLLRGRGELLVHGKLAATMGLAGLAIFFFSPTAVPPGAGLNDGEMVGFEWLKNVDAAGNACPSLHVAFAAFAGLWLDRILRAMHWPAPARALNACWCIGIVYSTLSTKQHVAVDVVAGAVLGVASGWIRPRRV